jgi:ADP-ribosylglycohydrolase
MKGNKKMGWAKIAFSYGLKFLILLQEGKIDLNSENIYKTWIEWVICRAGDTDTNAAISGGLIGAVIGFKQLPLEYLEKTFTLKYTS